MKKGSRNRNKLNSVVKLFIFLYLLVGVVYFSGSAILKSANVDLKRKNSLITEEITSLKSQVDTLNMEVDKLMEYTRVVESGNSATMTYSESRIFGITN